MRLRHYCPGCLTRIDLPVPEAESGSCTGCGRSWQCSPTDVERSRNVVDRCAFCAGRVFFIQRDFDQRVGCAIMAASVFTALWIGKEFGWIWFTPVLLSTVLIDWILAFRVKPVTICYRCNAEYRGVTVNPRHRNYDPHVAERYAAVKTVRRMGE